MAIRVTVELCPGGDWSNPQHLGTAIISNDGEGSVGSGNYNVWLSKWGELPPLWWTQRRHIWKQGRVESFARERLGPWDLLFRVLQATVGNRR